MTHICNYRDYPQQRQTNIRSDDTPPASTKNKKNRKPDLEEPGRRGESNQEIPESSIRDAVQKALLISKQ